MGQQGIYGCLQESQQQRFAEATMFKSGIYSSVPVPTHFVSVSRKAAFGAKRALDDNWKHDKIEHPEPGFRFDCQAGYVLSASAQKQE